MVRKTLANEKFMSKQDRVFFVEVVVRSAVTCFAWCTSMTDAL
jgi:hypothetical protein